MNENQKMRYSRQLFLPEIGELGQEKLLKARILIVGLGGLGCAAAYYLAAAGIGTLYLSDNELVELSNLQRQILYTTEDIGTLKTLAAKKHLSALNPDITIHTLQGLPTDSLPEDFKKILPEIDIVLDCTDNFATRFTLNELCLHYKIPLISGSALGWQGQVAFFALDSTDNACYECLYPKKNDESELPGNCEDSGVIGPLVGMIGNMQALLALNKILNTEKYIKSLLYSINAKSLEWKARAIKKDPVHAH